MGTVDLLSHKPTSWRPNNDTLEREGNHFHHVTAGFFRKCHFAARVGRVIRSGFGLCSCLSV